MVKEKILIIEDNFLSNSLNLEHATLEEKADVVLRGLDKKGIKAKLRIETTYEDGLDAMQSIFSRYDRIIIDISLMGPRTLGSSYSKEDFVQNIRAKSKELWPLFDEGLDRLTKKIRTPRPDTWSKEHEVNGYWKDGRVRLEGKLSTLDCLTDVFRPGYKDDIFSHIYDDPDAWRLIGESAGVDLAIKAKDMRLPFTIYTNDLGHAYNGLIMLLAKSIIKPNHIIEIVDGYTPIGLWNNKKGYYNKGKICLSRGGSIHLSRDMSLAVGSKNNPDNWIDLIYSLRQ